MKMKMKGQIESIYPSKAHKIKHKTSKKSKKRTSKTEQELSSKTALSEQKAQPKSLPQEDTIKNRASKNSQPLERADKHQTMQDIISRMMEGELSQGEALKMLRIRVLGLKQEDYAQLVGVSRKTLSENENNKGNYSAEVVNKVFHPFGLKVGLVAISSKAR
ncbi:helix-turn-helix domain-containing protein [Marinomonas sp. TI.3.20]|uniref:helix-turn-helix transcriptional regulator n=1 Tax=Marinomonas sp. TI.3.20 TaxID=3121296 RepID=UPI00311F3748